MSADKNSLLTGAESLLRYHQAIGISDYPHNDFLASFLEVNRTIKKRATAPAVPVPKPEKNTPDDGNELQTLAGEVAVCQRCSLQERRILATAGRGVAGSRLLIVGDWLGVKKEEDRNSIFGYEQDQMLKKMLQAISLDLKTVFVTNLIKCVLPHKEQPQADHVNACREYLRREILAVRPQLICTMGAVVSRAMLQRSQPLSRLRGRFYPYEVEAGAVVPLLPTYHPSFLLENPEMKRATWQDLQAIAARLGLRLKI